MKTIKLFLLATLFCAVWYPVAAAPVIQDNKPWSFIQLGIVPDAVALVPSDIPVLGVNAEFFCGTQKRVGIFNFQPIVGITDVQKGVSIQGFGFNDETVGLQFGLITFQNYFCGADFALLTGARENRGLQVGVLNLSGNAAPSMSSEALEPPAARGVQFGVINCTTNGFQFGVFNYNAESVIPLTILFNYSAR